jgi:creatine kinase
MFARATSRFGRNFSAVAGRGVARKINWGAVAAGSALAASGIVLSQRQAQNSGAPSGPKALNLYEFETKSLRDCLEGDHAEALARIYVMKKLYPDNLAIKHFSYEYFNSLSDAGKKGLLMVARSGIENPDSGMGCYAMQPGDYDNFKPYMDAVIRDYHGVPAGINHVTDWNLSGVKGLPSNGILDLTKLGLNNVSMRVRVGRNLAAFPLPGAMNKDDRLAMEAAMVGAFEKLIADPRYGGEYCSLTPGHKNAISPARYNQLVKDHIMFKDMAADKYLADAGIASDWPHGRGCYISKDRGFIVWVGEEDHLRIMCMKKGERLNDVFDRLKGALDSMESIPTCRFAHSKEYGYVTSCPTNLGTGMRASVHIAIPKLTKNGKDVSEAKAVCKALGLSVRGIGGEHTAAGEGGIVDISPSARFCIKEAEIVTALYLGIEKLIKKEQAL